MFPPTLVKEDEALPETADCRMDLTAVLRWPRRTCRVMQPCVAFGELKLLSDLRPWVAFGEPVLLSVI